MQVPASIIKKSGLLQTAGNYALNGTALFGLGYGAGALYDAYNRARFNAMHPEQKMDMMAEAARHDPRTMLGHGIGYQWNGDVRI